MNAYGTALNDSDYRLWVPKLSQRKLSEAVLSSNLCIGNNETKIFSIINRELSEKMLQSLDTLFIWNIHAWNYFWKNTMCWKLSGSACKANHWRCFKKKNDHLWLVRIWIFRNSEINKHLLLWAMRSLDYFCIHFGVLLLSSTNCCGNWVRLCVRFLLFGVARSELR